MKPLVTNGFDKILAMLFTNVAKSILRSKDLTKLDVHILMGVVSPVQELNANPLTACLREHMMPRFIVLLIVGGLYRLIGERHRLVSRTDQSKRRGKHRCRKGT